MKKKFRGRKLIVGFSAFLILTLSIGIIGIFQIHSLSKVIRELGREYLPRQKAVQEMKTNNAFYAMGVRNYVFWRTSKYLEAAAVASDVNFIQKSFQEFQNQLASYQSLAVSEKQKLWADELKTSSDELYSSGQKIIELANNRIVDEGKINTLLMAFENKFYKIDDFLGDRLSKNNLADIEKELVEARRKRGVSLMILAVSLAFSIFLGVSISFFEYEGIKEERLKREMLVHKMINLEEEDRKKLSRQIHDQLGQELSALKIYLELIEKDVPSENTEQKKRIEQSRKMLSGLIDKTHNISEMLRPPELDDLGLAQSIESLVSEYRNLTECNYVYHRPSSRIKLGAEDSLELYRVAQEALINIAKHSQAKNVEVSLGRRDDSVYLYVRDDGVGFDYEDYLKRPRRRKEDKLKLGLFGLRERMDLLGGSLVIETAPGKGTRIEAVLSV